MSEIVSSFITSTAVPDGRGRNMFEVDYYASPMAKLYLPDDLFKHLSPHFSRLGDLVGNELDELAHTADLNPPTLQVRTRVGTDTSIIEKHPSYVELEKTAYAEFGLAAVSHRAGVLGWDAPYPPAAKYALSHLFVQAEFGLCCPVSMTDSLARTLKRFGSQELIDRVLPIVTSTDFDEMQQGAMFMTEQGAGSDVSATETQAKELDNGEWVLYGDKWFCSNPDAGFAMVLARSEDKAGLAGVSLFLLPRYLEDGSFNNYRVLRLKNKLGTRSMASGEIRLDGAKAWLVGERGRGFQQMTDMINNSRLSNGMRAAGLMRRALAEAEYVVANRRAFNRRLVDMPLMQRQMLKMLVPTEQGRTMMYQTAQALERSDLGDNHAKSLVRILTPLIKFRACRDARKVTGDAMEVRGGCGYIEEFVDPRLLRDAHLGSIWEGTSNIVALDVLRAVERQNCLEPLRKHVDELLEQGVSCSSELHDLQQKTVDGVFDFMADVVTHNKSHLARQASTALYNVVSMAAMRWEARHEGLATRADIADLILLHRLNVSSPYEESIADATASKRLVEALFL